MAEIGQFNFSSKVPGDKRYTWAQTKNITLNRTISMTKRITPSLATSALVALGESGTPATDLLEILGPPPLLDGENRDHYVAIYTRMRSSVAPADMIEEIWVHDVVDLTWEILRLRRLKARLMEGRASVGVGILLRRLVDDDLELATEDQDRVRLVKGWTDRKASSVKRVDKLLAGAGFDRETVAAETLAASLSSIEPFDQMVIQGEGRRNAIIREIDHHRQAVARRLRDAVTEVEDVEFEDVTPSRIAEAA